jgi:hypothetical protein
MVRQSIVALALAGCATSTPPTAVRTGLTDTELQTVRRAAASRDGSFDRFWRARQGARPGLLKWSEAHSSAVPVAPPALLEIVRDELGRLNAVSRSGADVQVGVTIFRCERRWFGRREIGIEVAGRSGEGALVWAGVVTLSPSSAFARTAADSDEVLVARELVARLRRELGL